MLDLKQTFSRLALGALFLAALGVFGNAYGDTDEDKTETLAAPDNDKGNEKAAEKENEKSPGKVLMPVGWYLFGGLDAGISILHTSVTGEENKTGPGGNLKFLASHYWDNWVLDAGIGMEYKSISGTRPTGFQATLQTQALLLEADFRRRFNEQWELGVTLFANTATDVSHRPTFNPILTNEPSKDLIFLAGLQGLYTFRAWDLPVRAGLRLTTGLNVPNRSLYEVQGVIQIGLPLFSKKKEVGGPSPASIAPVAPEYFEIPLLRVLFESDSDELTPHSKEILARVGKYLKGHLESFTKIEVEGHTDHQGNFEYNIDLSQRRAESVGKVLIKNGVPNAILLWRGFGYSKPLDGVGSPTDKRNRRVMIKVYGAGEKSQFTTELSKLMEN